MNGKKAKLFRRVGNPLDRKCKKLYNKLTHREKETLGDVYSSLIEKHGAAKPEDDKKLFGLPHKSGLNRKYRRAVPDYQERVDEFEKDREQRSENLTEQVKDAVDKII